MKISPYLMFNGNCEEAIHLYEQAFSTKAESCRYKDAPPSEGYQPAEGTENYIMHAQFTIGNDAVFLCDTTPDMPSNFGNSISVHVELDSVDDANHAFAILKVDGSVGMELQPTFWSKLFGSLTDKFGINWMISLQENAGV